MREHVDHALAHEGRHAHGVAAVVREGEEGTAVGQVAAVQRDAVHERAHAELAHAVVDVVARAAAAAHGDAAARGRQIRAREVGGAAEQLGEHRLQRLDHVLRRLARGDRRRLGDRRRQHASDAVLPVRRQLAPAHAALELGRELGMGRGVGGKTAPPVAVARRTLSGRVPGSADLRGDLERHGCPAEMGACCRDFRRAEGRAVHLVRVRLVGAPVADHGLAAHERRPVALLARLAERRLDGRAVVAGHVADDAPAVGLEAGRGVVRKPVLDVAVDADAVVVVDRHQLRQPERSGERAGLVADALHQAAVAHEHPRAVIDDRMARAVEFRRQQALRQRHADGVGEPLAERAGGGLDAGRDAELRMAGGLAVQLTEALELLERQVVAGQVQQRVEQHRAVPGREDEAVAIAPVGIARVVLEIARPQDERVVGGTHRQAGMAAL